MNELMLAMLGLFSLSLVAVVVLIELLMRWLGRHL